MMTSLALPDRKVLSVDLYPKVTVQREVSVKARTFRASFSTAVSKYQGLGDHTLSRLPVALVSFFSTGFSKPIQWSTHMTRASRELMLSAVFLLFFTGAIVALPRLYGMRTCG